MIKNPQFSLKNNKIKIKNNQIKAEKGLKSLKLKLKRVEKSLLIATESSNKYLSFWKKAEADLINYKKIETAKISDSINYNTKIIISDLLPILNNFQRASQSISKEKEEDTHIKGFLYIEKEMKSILEQYGLKKIELKDKFDPNFHEIISSEEERVDLSKPYKIEEIEAGYILNEKIIKPTKIKIIYI